MRPMKPSALLPLLLLALAMAFAGCSTFASRAREKATVFAHLDAATRVRLEQGHLQLGDTTDMVYIALGGPEVTHDQESAEGAAVVWIYKTHWQEYRGESVVGYHAINATDPKTGAPQVYYEPVQQSLYQDREEEHLRITFRDGKVTVIERPKP